MHQNAGLWIDHQDAYIAFFNPMSASTQETPALLKAALQHLRFVETGSVDSSSSEDHRNRQIAGHRARFYDQIIAELHEARSVLIFGPGEAKGEFRKRMQVKGGADRIADVQTADRMTERQIVARTRIYFEAAARGLAMPS